MAIEQQTISSSSNVTTILGILLLVVAVTGLFVFVFPKKNSLNELASNISQKETQLNKSKAELTKLQSVKDSFKGSEVTEKDILNLIPNNIEQDEIIRTLAKYSDENEVTINSFSFGLSENTDGGYNMLMITINVSGTHGDLIKFLRSLEKDGRKFSVNTMSVQVLENGLENMSLNIAAFYL